MAGEPLDLNLFDSIDEEANKQYADTNATSAPAGRRPAAPKNNFQVDIGGEIDRQARSQFPQNDEGILGRAASAVKSAAGAVSGALSGLTSQAEPDLSPQNMPPPSQSDADKASLGTMAMGALSRARDAVQNAPTEGAIDYSQYPEQLGPAGGLTQEAAGQKRLEEAEQRAQKAEIRAPKEPRTLGSLVAEPSPEEAVRAREAEENKPGLLQWLLGANAQEAARSKRARENAQAFKEQALREGASPQDLGATQPSYIPGVSEAGQAAAGAVSGYTAGLLPALGEAYGLSQGPEGGKLGRLAYGAGQLVGAVKGVPEAVASQFSRAFRALMPAATSVPGVVAQEVARQVGHMTTFTTTQAVGPALEQKSVQDALRVEGEAAKSGGAMGLIFGAVGYVRVPESVEERVTQWLGTRAAAEAGAAGGNAAEMARAYDQAANQGAVGLSLAEKAARWALVSATNDAVSGDRPWDDRDWSQKVFDYGLNAYFMWHRVADPARTLRELDARARGEEHGLGGQGLDHFVQSTVGAKELIGEDTYKEYVKAFMEHGRRADGSPMDVFDAMASANQAVLDFKLTGRDPELTRTRRGEGLPGRPPLSHDALVALDDLTHAEERAKEVQPEPVSQPEEKPPHDIVESPRPASPAEYQSALEILKRDVIAMRLDDVERPDWMKQAGLGETPKTSLLLALDHLQRGTSDPQRVAVEEAIAKYAREHWTEIHAMSGIKPTEIGYTPPVEPQPPKPEAEIPPDILAGLDDLFGPQPPVAENEGAISAGRAENAAQSLPNETLDRMRRLAQLAAESAQKGVPAQRFFDAVTQRGADRGMVLRAMREAYPGFTPGAPHAPVPPSPTEGAAEPLGGTPEVPPAPPAEGRGARPPEGAPGPERPAGGQRPPGAPGAEAPERPGEQPRGGQEQPATGAQGPAAGPERPAAGAGERPPGAAGERPAAGQPGAPGGQPGQHAGPGGAEVGGGRWAGTVRNGQSHGRIGPGGRFHLARPEYTRELAAEPGDDVYLKGFQLNDVQQQGFLRMKASVLHGPHGSHFLADGTGVGKTRQLLAMAKYLMDKGEKVVYVAPQSALKIDMKLKKIAGTLGKEAALFGVPIKIHTGFDPVVPGLLHVMTIEKFQKLNPRPTDAERAQGHRPEELTIIADEAHFMKNVMKGTGRALHGLQMMNRAKYAIFATATPIDEPQHLVFLQRIGAYEGKTERDAMRELGMIMERAPNGKGSYWKAVNQRETDRRLGLLFDRLTYNGGARTADGGPDHSMPGTVTQRELAMEATLQGKEGKVTVNLSSIPMPKEVWAVVQKIVDGFAGHPGASWDEFKGMRKANVLHAVRRAMENYKIPATVQMVKKALAEGRQAVVFLDRTNEAEAGRNENIRDRWGNIIETVRVVFHQSEGTVPALLKALKDEGLVQDEAAEVGQIHSNKSAKQQIEDMKAFQSGQKKIVVATIGSGATGIDLDDQHGDKPRTMIVMTAPFSALEAVQAMGRVWRQQTQSFPETHFLHSELPIDQWNMGIIARKLNTLGAALSGPLVKTLALDEPPTPADLDRAHDIPQGDEGFREPRMPEVRPHDLSQPPTLRAFEESRARLLGDNAANQHEMDRALETLRNMPSRARVVDPNTGEVRAVGKMDPAYKQMMVSQMYKGDVGWIAVKELLQNAVDALRGVHDNTDGKIEMSVDPQNRIIHVKDNGVGMSPDVATREYVDIGGSLKQSEQASGGFGLAKVAIFGNSDSILVKTVGRGEDGKLYRTTLSGTGQEWLDDSEATGGLRVLTEEVPESTPTGTEITSRLRSEAKMDSYSARSAMDTFLARHKLPFDIALKFGGETVEPSTWTEKADEKIATLDTPGALIDVYAGKKFSDTRYPSITILNHGLPQFNKGYDLKTEAKLPATIIADVRAKKGPRDNEDYPFTTSREELKGEAEKALKQYVTQNLFAQAVERERQTYANAFKNAVMVKGTNMRLIDTGQRVPPEYLKVLAEKPIYTRLLRGLRDVFEEMQDQFQPYDPRFLNMKLDGYGLGSDYRAVHIPDKYVSPEGQGGKSHVLINPWTIVDGVQAAVDAEAIRPDQAPRAAASWMVAAIAHELTHEVAKGTHEEDFAIKLTDALARLGMTGYDNKATRKLEAVLRGEGTDNDYATIAHDLGALRDYWVAKEDDLFGKIGQHLGPAPGQPAGEGVPEGSPVGGGGPERSVRVGRPDVEGGSEPADVRAVDLNPRQRGLLDEVGRHVQDLHPDRAEWLRRMQDELPARFHAALDGVWDRINRDPAPAGRSLDEPRQDDALANEPAARAAIRNPFQRAAAQQTSSLAQSPGRVDLLQRMRDFLSIPIGGNRGLIGQRKNVLGHFVHRPGKSIDLRNMGDIQTLAHEVGHYISNRLFGPQYASSPERRAFFHTHSVALDALSQTHAQPSAEEGFAEFTRLYMTNPAFVHGRTLPPGVAGPPDPILALGRDFDKRLQEKDPELKTFLEGWSQDYRAWRGSSLNDRIKAKVAFDPAVDNQTWKDWGSKVYMTIFANSGPIERMVKDLSGGKMPSDETNAAMLRDLLQGSNRLAEMFLFRGVHKEGGAIDFNTRRRNGKSLEEVVEPIKDKVRDWSAYMIEKRLHELMTRDDMAAVKSRRQLYTALETSPQEVAKEIATWEQKHPEFKQAHDDFQEWNQNLLEYMTKAGLLTPTAAKTIADMNKSYFPFYRVFSSAEQARESAVQGSSGGPKRLKGSGRDFMNPLEGAIRNAYSYIKLAEKNAVLLKMADTALDPKASEKSEHGGQYWMKRVPPQLKAMKVPPAEVMGKIRQDLIALGIPPDLIDGFLDALHHEDVAQFVTLFRADHGRLQPNEVVVMRRGHPEHYIVHPLLKQSIDQMMRPEADMLNRLYSFIPSGWARGLAKAAIEGPARLLRAGATLAPEFGLRNPFRDVFDRAWFSERQTRIPLLGPMMDLTLAMATMPRGALSSIRGDKWRDAWLRGGGEMALASMDPRALQRKLDDVLKGRPSGVSTAGWVLNPIQWLRAMSTISEEANRIEEFRYAMKKQGVTDPTQATKEQLQVAAHAGLTNPLDFGRMGTFMKWTGMNRAAAFSNVSLASWDKVVRELKGPNWAQRLNFAVSAVTIPSLLLWYYNHDDARWKDIPQWQKDLAWIVFTKKMTQDQWDALSPEERVDPNIVGHVWRLPKPWQLGIIFGSVPERIADWAYGVDKSFKDLLFQALSEARLNSPIPTAMQTVWALGTNHDSFTGRPIITRGMEDLAPEDQIGPGTHKAAIWLAHGISSISGGSAPDSLRSPQAMDAIIYRTGGNLGRLSADLVDLATKSLDEAPEPAATTADIPGVRGFAVRFPSASAESIEDFYREYTRLQQVGHGASWRRKNGKDADEYVTQHELDLASLPAATQSAKQLANIRAQMREIQMDREMSPAEKRKALDQASLEMIETAREALGNLRDIKSGG